MILTIYKRVLNVLLRKPVKLWALSLLCTFLSAVGSALFGIIPGVALAISVLFSVSMTMVYLHGYRREEIQTVQLFDAFRGWETIKRVCLGMGWMILWIFIWIIVTIATIAVFAAIFAIMSSFLGLGGKGWIIFIGIVSTGSIGYGIVRAIILIYEYRLTPYILVTEPDVSITDAIKVSKERTTGYKKHMFWADILPTVLVWVVLLILGLFAKIPHLDDFFTFIAVVFGIVAALLLPLFKGLVSAAFYEEISNPSMPTKQSMPESDGPIQYVSSNQDARPTAYTAPVWEPAPEQEEEPTETVFSEAPVVTPELAVSETPAWEAPVEEAPAVEEPAVEAVPESKPVEDTGARFCTSCGAPLMPGALFCTSCGVKVK